MNNNQKVLSETLKAWLPLAATIVIFSGLIYVAVQQNYRQAANDQPTQIAEDIANAIIQGMAEPGDILPPNKTDIKKNLLPFVLIYDDTGKQLGSSALLNDKDPEYPKGVLDSVKQQGEKKITWEPEAGVRMATVVTRYTGKFSGFVVVGRSLREVEAHINNLTAMTALATGLALIVSLLLIFFFKKMDGDRGHKLAEVDVVVTEI